jgi:hypothetical protein
LTAAVNTVHDQAVHVLVGRREGGRLGVAVRETDDARLRAHLERT